MLLTPDCIHCVFRASLNAIRSLTSDEEITKRLAQRILQIPALRGLDWSVTSPQVIESAWLLIGETLGEVDPYRQLKERQTLRAMELYPRLKKLIDGSQDPLDTAIRIAVMGNWIDLMWSFGSEDVEFLISELEKKAFCSEALDQLANEIASSEVLVYLGDNSGEIVFDKLLIETMRDLHHIDTFFVVRSCPTLNDATLREAHMVGMQQVAVVLENGINGPFPGTSIARCSDRVRNLLGKADLVISKGGGNFDSLHEERHLLRRTAFLLMSKCTPLASHFGVPLKQPIVALYSSHES
ncbi:MAG: damage-control phosphatase ARMT1 family protein [Desulfomonilaceae bacterium]